jgi:hypothetical protein
VFEHLFPALPRSASRISRTAPPRCCQLTNPGHDPQPTGRTDVVRAVLYDLLARSAANTPDEPSAPAGPNTSAGRQLRVADRRAHDRAAEARDPSGRTVRRLPRNPFRSRQRRRLQPPVTVPPKGPVALSPGSTWSRPRSCRPSSWTPQKSQITRHEDQDYSNVHHQAFPE